jgi:hypothetical protein
MNDVCIILEGRFAGEIFADYFKYYRNHFNVTDITQLPFM